MTSASNGAPGGCDRAPLAGAANRAHAGAPKPTGGAPKPTGGAPKPTGGARWDRGITLYEVVLSLAILLVSLAALSQLLSTGSRAAVQSRLQTEATLLCQTKLAEIQAGIELMQPVSQAPLPEAGPEWVWSLEVLEGPHPDLLELEVTVSHLDDNNRPDAGSSLRRYVRDPQLFLDAAALEAEIEAAQLASETGETM